MIINIDTEIVSKAKLTIVEYILLYLLFNDCKNTLEATTELILSLESKGYIKDQQDGIILRKKTLDLFATNSIPTKAKDLDEFVDKYRELFPQGVKSGGYLLKGDKQGCINKFKSFLKKYPEYTKEEILDATKAYLDGKRKTNFDKTQLAHYFIEKDGISNLSSFCEDIKIRGNQVIKQDTGIGKTKGI